VAKRTAPLLGAGRRQQSQTRRE